MNSVIYNTNDSFDFNKLSMNPPMVNSGGNYFIKYVMDGRNLYIQPPECKTRGGISKSSKNPSCDLMFSQENVQLIKWMEDLETYSCKLIYENREQWFESEMELVDIENYFASPLKSYKSGKFYLVRTSLPSRLGKINLKIYNENKEEVKLENIVDGTNVFTVLEVLGIKCSARSFQIEMEIKQMMTLEPVNLFDNCVIDYQRDVIVHSNKQESEPITIDIEGETNLEENEQENEEEKKEDIVQESETLEETSLENVMQEEPTLENNEVLEIKEENERQTMEKEDEENKVHEENVEPNNEPIQLDDLEFTVDLDSLSNEEPISIKPHNDIYYERYREARKRAYIAKNMALQAFLEAKEIKHKYQLDDIESDDNEENFINQEMDFSEKEKEEPAMA